MRLAAHHHHGTDVEECSSSSSDGSRSSGRFPGQRDFKVCWEARGSPELGQQRCPGSGLTKQATNKRTSNCHSKHSDCPTALLRHWRRTRTTHQESGDLGFLIYFSTMVCDQFKRGASTKLWPSTVLGFRPKHFFPAAAAAAFSLSVEHLATKTSVRSTHHNEEKSSDIVKKNKKKQKRRKMLFICKTFLINKDVV